MNYTHAIIVITDEQPDVQLRCYTCTYVCINFYSVKASMVNVVCASSISQVQAGQWTIMWPSAFTNGLV